VDPSQGSETTTLDDSVVNSSARPVAAKTSPSTNAAARIASLAQTNHAPVLGLA
jgi:hypothetical protein